MNKATPNFSQQGFSRKREKTTAGPIPTDFRTGHRGEEDNASERRTTTTTTTTTATNSMNHVKNNDNDDEHSRISDACPLPPLERILFSSLSQYFGGGGVFDFGFVLSASTPLHACSREDDDGDLLYCASPLSLAIESISKEREGAEEIHAEAADTCSVDQPRSNTHLGKDNNNSTVVDVDEKRKKASPLVVKRASSSSDICAAPFASSFLSSSYTNICTPLLRSAAAAVFQHVVCQQPTMHSLGGAHPMNGTSNHWRWVKSVLLVERNMVTCAGWTEAEEAQEYVSMKRTARLATRRARVLLRNQEILLKNKQAHNNEDANKDNDDKSSTKSNTNNTATSTTTGEEEEGKQKSSQGLSDLLASQLETPTPTQTDDNRAASSEDNETEAEASEGEAVVASTTISSFSDPRQKRSSSSAHFPIGQQRISSSPSRASSSGPATHHHVQIKKLTVVSFSEVIVVSPTKTAAAVSTTSRSSTVSGPAFPEKNSAAGDCGGKQRAHTYIQEASAPEFVGITAYQKVTIAPYSALGTVLSAVAQHPTLLRLSSQTRQAVASSSKHFSSGNNHHTNQGLRSSRIKREVSIKEEDETEEEGTQKKDGRDNIGNVNNARDTVIISQRATTLPHFPLPSCMSREDTSRINRSNGSSGSGQPLTRRYSYAFAFDSPFSNVTCGGDKRIRTAKEEANNERGLGLPDAPPRRRWRELLPPSFSSEKKKSSPNVKIANRAAVTKSKHANLNTIRIVNTLKARAEITIAATTRAALRDLAWHRRVVAVEEAFAEWSVAMAEHEAFLKLYEDFVEQQQRQQQEEAQREILRQQIEYRFSLNSFCAEEEMRQEGGGEREEGGSGKEHGEEATEVSDQNNPNFNHNNHHSTIRGASSATSENPLSTSYMNLSKSSNPQTPSIFLSAGGVGGGQQMSLTNFYQRHSHLNGSSVLNSSSNSVSDIPAGYGTRSASGGGGGHSRAWASAEEGGYLSSSNFASPVGSGQAQPRARSLTKQSLPHQRKIVNQEEEDQYNLHHTPVKENNPQRSAVRRSPSNTTGGSGTPSKSPLSPGLGQQALLRGSVSHVGHRSLPPPSPPAQNLPMVISTDQVSAGSPHAMPRTSTAGIISQQLFGASSLIGSGSRSGSTAGGGGGGGGAATLRNSLMGNGGVTTVGAGSTASGTTQQQQRPLLSSSETRNSRSGSKNSTATSHMEGSVTVMTMMLMSHQRGSPAKSRDQQERVGDSEGRARGSSISGSHATSPSQQLNNSHPSKNLLGAVGFGFGYGLFDEDDDEENGNQNMHSKDNRASGVIHNSPAAGADGGSNQVPAFASANGYYSVSPPPAPTHHQQPPRDLDLDNRDVSAEARTKKEERRIALPPPPPLSPFSLTPPIIPQKGTNKPKGNNKSPRNKGGETLSSPSSPSSPSSSLKVLGTSKAKDQSDLVVGGVEGGVQLSSPSLTTIPPPTTTTTQEHATAAGADDDASSSMLLLLHPKHRRESTATIGPHTAAVRTRRRQKLLLQKKGSGESSLVQQQQQQQQSSSSQSSSMKGTMSVEAEGLVGGRGGKGANENVDGDEGDDVDVQESSALLMLGFSSGGDESLSHSAIEEVYGLLGQTTPAVVVIEGASLVGEDAFGIVDSAVSSKLRRPADATTNTTTAPKEGEVSHKDDERKPPHAGNTTGGCCSGSTTAVLHASPTDSSASDSSMASTKTAAMLAESTHTIKFSTGDTPTATRSNDTLNAKTTTTSMMKSLNASSSRLSVERSEAQSSDLLIMLGETSSVTVTSAGIGVFGVNGGTHSPFSPSFSTSSPASSDRLFQEIPTVSVDRSDTRNNDTNKNQPNLKKSQSHATRSQRARTVVGDGTTGPLLNLSHLHVAPAEHPPPLPSPHRILPEINAAAAATSASTSDCVGNSSKPTTTSKATATIIGMSKNDNNNNNINEHMLVIKGASESGNSCDDEDDYEVGFLPPPGHRHGRRSLSIPYHRRRSRSNNNTNSKGLLLDAAPSETGSSNSGTPRHREASYSDSHTNFYVRSNSTYAILENSMLRAEIDQQLHAEEGPPRLLQAANANRGSEGRTREEGEVAEEADVNYSPREGEDKTKVTPGRGERGGQANQSNVQQGRRRRQSSALVVGFAASQQPSSVGFVSTEIVVEGSQNQTSSSNFSSPRWPLQNRKGGIKLGGGGKEGNTEELTAAGGGVSARVRRVSIAEPIASTAAEPQSIPTISTTITTTSNGADNEDNQNESQHHHTGGSASCCSSFSPGGMPLPLATAESSILLGGGVGFINTNALTSTSEFPIFLSLHHQEGGEVKESLPFLSETGAGEAVGHTLGATGDHHSKGEARSEGTQREESEGGTPAATATDLLATTNNSNNNTPHSVTILVGAGHDGVANGVAADAHSPTPPLANSTDKQRLFFASSTSSSPPQPLPISGGISSSTGEFPSQQQPQHHQQSSSSISSSSALFPSTLGERSNGASVAPPSYTSYSNPNLSARGGAALQQQQHSAHSTDSQQIVPLSRGQQTHSNSLVDLTNWQKGSGSVLVSHRHESSTRSAPAGCVVGLLAASDANNHPDSEQNHQHQLQRHNTSSSAITHHHHHHHLHSADEENAHGQNHPGAHPHHGQREAKQMLQHGKQQFVPGITSGQAANKGNFFSAPSPSPSAAVFSVTLSLPTASHILVRAGKVISESVLGAAADATDAFTAEGERGGGPTSSFGASSRAASSSGRNQAIGKAMAKWRKARGGAPVEILTATVTAAACKKKEKERAHNNAQQNEEGFISPRHHGRQRIYSIAAVQNRLSSYVPSLDALVQSTVAMQNAPTAAGLFHNGLMPLVGENPPPHSPSDTGMYTAYSNPFRDRRSVGEGERESDSSISPSRSDVLVSSPTKPPSTGRTDQRRHRRPQSGGSLHQMHPNKQADSQQYHHADEGVPLMTVSRSMHTANLSSASFGSPSSPNYLSASPTSLQAKNANSNLAVNMNASNGSYSYFSQSSPLSGGLSPQSPLTSRRKEMISSGSGTAAGANTTTTTEALLQRSVRTAALLPLVTPAINATAMATATPHIMRLQATPKAIGKFLNYSHQQKREAAEAEEAQRSSPPTLGGVRGEEVGGGAAGNQSVFNTSLMFPASPSASSPGFDVHHNASNAIGEQGGGGGHTRDSRVSLALSLAHSPLNANAGRLSFHHHHQQHHRAQQQPNTPYLNNPAQPPSSPTRSDLAAASPHSRHGGHGVREGGSISHSILVGGIGGEIGLTSSSSSNHHNQYYQNQYLPPTTPRTPHTNSISSKGWAGAGAGTSVPHSSLLHLHAGGGGGGGQLLTSRSSAPSNSSGGGGGTSINRIGAIVGSPISPRKALSYFYSSSQGGNTNTNITMNSLSTGGATTTLPQLLVRATPNQRSVSVVFAGVDGGNAAPPPMIGGQRAPAVANISSGGGKGNSNISPPRHSGQSGGSGGGRDSGASPSLFRYDDSHDAYLYHDERSIKMAAVGFLSGESGGVGEGGAGITAPRINRLDLRSLPSAAAVNGASLTSSLQQQQQKAQTSAGPIPFFGALEDPSETEDVLAMIGLEGGGDAFSARGGVAQYSARSRVSSNRSQQGAPPPPPPPPLHSASSASTVTDEGEVKGVNAGATSLLGLDNVQHSTRAAEPTATATTAAVSSVSVSLLNDAFSSSSAAGGLGVGVEEEGRASQKPAVSFSSSYTNPSTSSSTGAANSTPSFAAATSMGTLAHHSVSYTNSGHRNKARQQMAMTTSTTAHDGGVLNKDNSTTTLKRRSGGGRGVTTAAAANGAVTQGIEGPNTWPVSGYGPTSTLVVGAVKYSEEGSSSSPVLSQVPFSPASEDLSLDKAHPHTQPQEQQQHNSLLQLHNRYGVGGNTAGGGSPQGRLIPAKEVGTSTPSTSTFIKLMSADMSRQSQEEYQETVGEQQTTPEYVPHDHSQILEQQRAAAMHSSQQSVANMIDTDLTRVCGEGEEEQQQQQDGGGGGSSQLFPSSLVAQQRSRSISLGLARHQLMLSSTARQQQQVSLPPDRERGKWPSSPSTSHHSSARQQTTVLGARQESSDTFDNNNNNSNKSSTTKRSPSLRLNINDVRSLAVSNAAVVGNTLSQEEGKNGREHPTATATVEDQQNQQQQQQHTIGYTNSVHSTPERGGGQRLLTGGTAHNRSSPSHHHHQIDVDDEGAVHPQYHNNTRHSQYTSPNNYLSNASAQYSTVSLPLSPPLPPPSYDQMPTFSFGDFREGQQREVLVQAALGAVDKASLLPPTPPLDDEPRSSQQTIPHLLEKEKGIFECFSSPAQANQELLRRTLRLERLLGVLRREERFLAKHVPLAATKGGGGGGGGALPIMESSTLLRLLCSSASYSATAAAAAAEGMMHSPPHHRNHASAGGRETSPTTNQEEGKRTSSSSSPSATTMLAALTTLAARMNNKNNTTSTTATTNNKVNNGTAGCRQASNTNTNTTNATALTAEEEEAIMGATVTVSSSDHHFHSSRKQSSNTEGGVSGGGLGTARSHYTSTSYAGTAGSSTTTTGMMMLMPASSTPTSTLQQGGVGGGGPSASPVSARGFGAVVGFGYNKESRMSAAAGAGGAAATATLTGGYSPLPPPPRRQSSVSLILDEDDAQLAIINNKEKDPHQEQAAANSVHVKRLSILSSSVARSPTRKPLLAVAAKGGGQQQHRQQHHVHQHEAEAKKVPLHPTNTTPTTPTLRMLYQYSPQQQGERGRTTTTTRGSSHGAEESSAADADRRRPRGSDGSMNMAGGVSRTGSRSVRYTTGADADKVGRTRSTATTASSDGRSSVRGSSSNNPQVKNPANKRRSGGSRSKSGRALELETSFGENNNNNQTQTNSRRRTSSEQQYEEGGRSMMGVGGGSRAEIIHGLLNKCRQVRRSILMHEVNNEAALGGELKNDNPKRLGSEEEQEEEQHQRRGGRSGGRSKRNSTFLPAYDAQDDENEEGDDGMALFEPQRLSNLFELVEEEYTTRHLPQLLSYRAKKVTIDRSRSFLGQLLGRSGARLGSAASDATNALHLDFVMQSLGGAHRDYLALAKRRKREMKALFEQKKEQQEEMHQLLQQRQHDAARKAALALALASAASEEAQQQRNIPVVKGEGSPKSRSVSHTHNDIKVNQMTKEGQSIMMPAVMTAATTATSDGQPTLATSYSGAATVASSSLVKLATILVNTIDEVENVEFPNNNNNNNNNNNSEGNKNSSTPRLPLAFSPSSHAAAAGPLDSFFSSLPLPLALSQTITTLEHEREATEEQRRIVRHVARRAFESSLHEQLLVADFQWISAASARAALARWTDVPTERERMARRRRYQIAEEARRKRLMILAKKALVEAQRQEEQEKNGGKTAAKTAKKSRKSGEKEKKKRKKNNGTAEETNAERRQPPTRRTLVRGDNTNQENDDDATEDHSSSTKSFSSNSSSSLPSSSLDGSSLSSCSLSLTSSTCSSLSSSAFSSSSSSYVSNENQLLTAPIAPPGPAAAAAAGGGSLYPFPQRRRNTAAAGVGSGFAGGGVPRRASPLSSSSSAVPIISVQNNENPPTAAAAAEEASTTNSTHHLNTSNRSSVVEEVGSVNNFTFDLLAIQRSKSRRLDRAAAAVAATSTTGDYGEQLSRTKLKSDDEKRKEKRRKRAKKLRKQKRRAEKEEKQKRKRREEEAQQRRRAAENMRIAPDGSVTIVADFAVSSSFAAKEEDSNSSGSNNNFDGGESYSTSDSHSHSSNSDDSSYYSSDSARRSDEEDDDWDRRYSKDDDEEGEKEDYDDADDDDDDASTASTTPVKETFEEKMWNMLAAMRLQQQQQQGKASNTTTKPVMTSPSNANNTNNNSSNILSLAPQKGATTGIREQSANGGGGGVGTFLSADNLHGHQQLLLKEMIKKRIEAQRQARQESAAAKRTTSSALQEKRQKSAGDSNVKPKQTSSNSHNNNNGLSTAVPPIKSDKLRSGSKSVVDVVEEEDNDRALFMMMHLHEDGKDANNNNDNNRKNKESAAAARLTKRLEASISSASARGGGGGVTPPTSPRLVLMKRSIAGGSRSLVGGMGGLIGIGSPRAKLQQQQQYVTSSPTTVRGSGAARIVSRVGRRSSIASDSASIISKSSIASYTSTSRRTSRNSTNSISSSRRRRISSGRGKEGEDDTKSSRSKRRTTEEKEDKRRNKNNDTTIRDSRRKHRRGSRGSVMSALSSNASLAFSTSGLGEFGGSRSTINGLMGSSFVAAAAAGINSSAAGASKHLNFILSKNKELRESKGKGALLTAAANTNGNQTSKERKRASSSFTESGAEHDGIRGEKRKRKYTNTNANTNSTYNNYDNHNRRLSDASSVATTASSFSTALLSQSNMGMMSSSSYKYRSGGPRKKPNTSVTTEEGKRERGREERRRRRRRHSSTTSTMLTSGFDEDSVDGGIFRRREETRGGRQQNRRKRKSVESRISSSSATTNRRGGGRGRRKRSSYNDGDDGRHSEEEEEDLLFFSEQEEENNTQQAFMTIGAYAFLFGGGSRRRASLVSAREAAVFDFHPMVFAVGIQRQHQQRRRAKGSATMQKGRVDPTNNSNSTNTHNVNKKQRRDDQQQQQQQSNQLSIITSVPRTLRKPPRIEPLGFLIRNVMMNFTMAANTRSTYDHHQHAINNMYAAAAWTNSAAAAAAIVPTNFLGVQTPPSGVLQMVAPLAVDSNSPIYLDNRVYQQKNGVPATPFAFSISGGGASAAPSLRKQQQQHQQAQPAAAGVSPMTTNGLFLTINTAGLLLGVPHGDHSSIGGGGSSTAVRSGYVFPVSARGPPQFSSASSLAVPPAPSLLPSSTTGVDGEGGIAPFQSTVSTCNTSSQSLSYQQQQQQQQQLLLLTSSLPSLSPQQQRNKSASVVVTPLSYAPLALEEGEGPSSNKLTNKISRQSNKLTSVVADSADVLLGVSNALPPLPPPTTANFVTTTPTTIVNAMSPAIDLASPLSSALISGGGAFNFFSSSLGKGNVTLTPPPSIPLISIAGEGEGGGQPASSSLLPADLPSHHQDEQEGEKEANTETTSNNNSDKRRTVPTPIYESSVGEDNNQKTENDEVSALNFDFVEVPELRPGTGGPPPQKIPHSSSSSTNSNSDNNNYHQLLMSSADEGSASQGGGRRVLLGLEAPSSPTRPPSSPPEPFPSSSSPQPHAVAPYYYSSSVPSHPSSHPNAVREGSEEKHEKSEKEWKNSYPLDGPISSTFSPMKSGRGASQQHRGGLQQQQQHGGNNDRVLVAAASGQSISMSLSPQPVDATQEPQFARRPEASSSSPPPLLVSMSASASVRDDSHQTMPVDMQRLANTPHTKEDTRRREKEENVDCKANNQIEKKNKEEEYKRSKVHGEDSQHFSPVRVVEEEREEEEQHVEAFFEALDAIVDVSLVSQASHSIAMRGEGVPSHRRAAEGSRQPKKTSPNGSTTTPAAEDHGALAMDMDMDVESLTESEIMPIVITQEEENSTNRREPGAVDVSTRTPRRRPPTSNPTPPTSSEGCADGGLFGWTLATPSRTADVDRDHSPSNRVGPLFPLSARPTPAQHPRPQDENSPAAVLNESQNPPANGIHQSFTHMSNTTKKEGNTTIDDDIVLEESTRNAVLAFEDDFLRSPTASQRSAEDVRGELRKASSYSLTSATKGQYRNNRRRADLVLPGVISEEELGQRAFAGRGGDANLNSHNPHLVVNEEDEEADAFSDAEDSTPTDADDATNKLPPTAVSDEHLMKGAPRPPYLAPLPDSPRGSHPQGAVPRHSSAHIAPFRSLFGASSSLPSQPKSKAPETEIETGVEDLHLRSNPLDSLDWMHAKKNGLGGGEEGEQGGGVRAGHTHEDKEAATNRILLFSSSGSMSVSSQKIQNAHDPPARAEAGAGANRKRRSSVSSSVSHCHSVSSSTSSLVPAGAQTFDHKQPQQKEHAPSAADSKKASSAVKYAVPPAATHQQPQEQLENDGDKHTKTDSLKSAHPTLTKSNSNKKKDAACTIM